MSMKNTASGAEVLKEARNVGIQGISLPLVTDLPRQPAKISRNSAPTNSSRKPHLLNAQLAVSTALVQKSSKRKNSKMQLKQSTEI